MRIKTSGLHIEIGVVYKTLTNVTSALIIVYNRWQWQVALLFNMEKALLGAFFE